MYWNSANLNGKVRETQRAGKEENSRAKSEKVWGRNQVVEIKERIIRRKRLSI